MIIYLLNISLILVWGIFLIYNKTNDKKRLMFCVISSVQWILISGLRNSEVGADTANYINRFESADTYSWETILKAFRDVYLSGDTLLSSGDPLYKDPGYFAFQKIVHIFTDNAQIYLLIVAVIIFASLAYFIYKNSDDPVFSYILFSTLFYSFYAITGIRQALATALIVFIGFEFIKERKIWRFIVIAVIAFTLHKSALVFVPFYFISKKKVTWKYVGFLCGLTAILLSLGPGVILTLSAFVGYDYESVYQGNTFNYTLIMSLVGIAAIIFFKYIQRKGKVQQMELNATLLATALTILTTIAQGMMRIQQYYALFLMFSIPEILNCFEKRSRAVLRILCITILILYLMRNNPQYMFFWQSN